MAGAGGLGGAASAGGVRAAAAPAAPEFRRPNTAPGRPPLRPRNLGQVLLPTPDGGCGSLEAGGAGLDGRRLNFRSAAFGGRAVDDLQSLGGGGQSLFANGGGRT